MLRTSFWIVAALAAVGLATDRVHAENDSSIVAWGNNDEGQCDTPPPNAGFIAVGAGAMHSLGVKADGSVVAWGLNSKSQCDVPPPNKGFVSLSGGAAHGVGLTAGGCDADCDGGGTLDLFDFLCFVNRFNAGCG